MSIWHYSKGGKQNGPVSTDELKRLVSAGEVQTNDLVWSEGMTGWQPVSKVPDLMAARPAGPPPLPQESPSLKPVLQAYWKVICASVDRLCWWKKGADGTASNDSKLRTEVGGEIVSSDPLVVRPLKEDLCIEISDDGTRHRHFRCGQCGLVQKSPSTILGKETDCVACKTKNKLPHDLFQIVYFILGMFGLIAVGLFYILGCIFSGWFRAVSSNSDMGHGEWKRPCPRCGAILPYGLAMNQERCPNCRARLP